MSSVNFLEKLLGGVNVEWVALEKVVKTITAPSKLKSQSYCTTGKLPIIDQGIEFIAGYTDEDIVPVAKGEYIVFGDHSEHIKYVNFSFVQGADGIKILRILNNNAKYIYYAFLNFYKKELSYKRHWSTAQQTLIPIPCPDNPKKSLEIQAEIVRILDAMTDHAAELTAELTARKKQYNYYRDKLMSFEEGEVEWKTLGDVAILRRGRVISKGYLSDNPGSFPVFSSQTANNGVIGEIDSFDFDGEYISWTTDGANAGTVFHRTGKFSITNVCGLVKIKNESLLNYKFLYYWLSIEAKKHVYSGMGNPKLMSHQVEKIPVPIPYPQDPMKSLIEQKRVASILDKLEALTFSLIEGLPREIELRQKQYSYSRDLLLSFPQAQAA